MDIGLIFALLAGVSFAGSNVFVRKGTFRAGESFSAVAITIFIGVLFFSLLTLFTGDWVKLQSLSWQGFALLSIAGISHFVFGRFLAYVCFRLIGANRGTPILRTANIYAVILGIIILNEPVSVLLIMGVLGITTGVTLVGLEKGHEVRKIYTRGILAGLGGAFFWGTSGILIKPMIAEVGSPYAAGLIAYFAAFLVIAGLSLRKRQREQFIQLRRESLVPICIAGILGSVAQLFRYTALGYSPVSLVVPITSTSVIFTLLLSFLVNRQIEVFSQKVFWGIAVTVVGTLLLFQ